MKTTQTIFNRLLKSSKLAETTVSYVENGVYYLSSIDEWIQEPVDLPDGTYTMIAGKLHKISELSEVRVTHPEMINETSWKMDSDDVTAILNFSKSVSKDELRPVMQCIAFIDNEMVSTDAHVLQWRKVTHPYKQVLLKPTPTLLSLIKDSTPVMCATHENVFVKTAEFTYGQVQVDGKYPAYKSVIPSVDKDAKAFSFDTKELQGIAKEVNGIKKTGEVMVKDTTMTCKNYDTNISQTWEINKTNLPDREPDGLIMPIELNEESEFYDFGFNPSFLLKLASGRNAVTFAVSQPLRAFLVWFDTNTQPKKKVAKIASKQPKKAISENKPTKPQVTTKEPETTIVPASIQLIDYTEKSIVVTGDTKPIKDALKNAGGRWNKFLKDANGNNFGGWVFSKRKKQAVNQILEQV